MFTPIAFAMMWASVVLPRPGGSAQQDVLEHVATLFRRFDQHLDPFTDLHLAGELAEHRRPQRNFEGRIRMDGTIIRRSGEIEPRITRMTRMEGSEDVASFVAAPNPCQLISAGQMIRLFCLLTPDFSSAPIPSRGCAERNRLDQRRCGSGAIPTRRAGSKSARPTLHRFRLRLLPVVAQAKTDAIILPSSESEMNWSSANGRHAG